MDLPHRVAAVAHFYSCGTHEPLKQLPMAIKTGLSTRHCGLPARDSIEARSRSCWRGVSQPSVFEKGCDSLKVALMNSVLRRSFSALGVVVVLGLVAPCVSAETEENRATARALATQGIAAFNEGRFADALDLFSRAETVLHAPPHLLYMARSAAKVGQLVRAHELYLKLLREPLAATAPQPFRDAVTAAREEVKGIEPRIASIVIKVSAPPGVTYEVEMDQKPVSAAVVGVPIPEDPGRHRLTATAAGYACKPVEVTLAEGGHGEATLVLEPTGEAPPPVVARGTPPAPTPTATPSAQAQPAAPPPPPPQSSEQPPPPWMRPASYVAAGVGVLGIGLGTYFALRSSSLRGDADDLAAECGPLCLKTDPLAARITSRDNSARSAQTASAVSFVIGGLGVATGVTLFVLSYRRSTTSAYSFEPYVGFGSTGFRGTW